MRRLALSLILLASACGSTPTAPAPSPTDDSWRLVFHHKFSALYDSLTAYQESREASGDRLYEDFPFCFEDFDGEGYITLEDGELVEHESCALPYGPERAAFDEERFTAELSLLATSSAAFDDLAPELEALIGSPGRTAEIFSDIYIQDQDIERFLTYVKTYLENRTATVEQRLDCARLTTDAEREACSDSVVDANMDTPKGKRIYAKAKVYLWEFASSYLLEPMWTDNTLNWRDDYL